MTRELTDNFPNGTFYLKMGISNPQLGIIYRIEDWVYMSLVTQSQRKNHQSPIRQKKWYLKCPVGDNIPLLLAFHLKIICFSSGCLVNPEFTLCKYIVVNSVRCLVMNWMGGAKTMASLSGKSHGKSLIPESQLHPYAKYHLNLAWLLICLTSVVSSKLQRHCWGLNKLESVALLITDPTISTTLSL